MKYIYQLKHSISMKYIYQLKHSLSMKYIYQLKHIQYQSNFSKPSMNSDEFFFYCMETGMKGLFHECLDIYVHPRHFSLRILHMGLCKMMIYGVSDSGEQITSDFSLYKLSLKEVFLCKQSHLNCFFPLPECTLTYYSFRSYISLTYNGLQFHIWSFLYYVMKSNVETFFMYVNLNF